MSLAEGSRIGPYEVLVKLGEGGMGEVYRGRDTKLGRDVAIKALQPLVASDGDRVARFEREAQLLASLNHPNIAGIYGLEQTLAMGSTPSATFLVLEFVDGTPLDALLRSGGALPPREALAIARQIADAIAAAHEKGIIHRDLKPGNIMVTGDGLVKVLDFGLGKSIDDGRTAAGESAPSNSPTITLGATQAGVILGTAGYMSPEQAKGRSADRRSDVWSFGCVLFEMLSGSRAFEGEDVTDTIAAIVRGEPNWKALPAGTPPALRQLLERTLIKDRTQRLPDMSVVRYVLSEAGNLAEAGPSGPAGAAGSKDPASITEAPAYDSSRRSSRLWMYAALISIATTIALGVGYINRDSIPSSSAGTGAPSHFTIVLPDDARVSYTNMAPLAISPNGQMAAFSAWRAGKIQLYLNDFSTGETKALDGTDDARSPFFSPDGRWIAFFGRGKLTKITTSGTSLVEVADAPDGRGGTWSSDNVIYYAPNNATGLWKVSADGGTATQFTKPDAAAAEISHRYPLAIPGGKALLFLIWTGPGSDEHRIEYLSIADGARQVVARNADGPLALINGRVIYAGQQDSLLSVPFDPSRPGVQGVEPVALPFLAQMDNEGAAAYAVSDNGTVVRLQGHAERRLAQVVWVDRTGKVEPLPLPGRDYVSATLSPDGARAAIHNRGRTEEIWIYDFATKSFTPLLTAGGSSQAPVWTTDSKYIVYRGTRQGFRNVFMKAADGSGEEMRLTTKGGVIQTPTSATADGKWIVYLESGGAGAGDLMKVALDGDHKTLPLVATPAQEISGQASYDGRWVAFESSVTGRSEIWLQPLGPDGATNGAARKVSYDGGTAPRWSRDSRELFFATPEGIMGMTVSGNTISQPRQIVSGRYRPSANANTNYDVAGDGRFIHVLAVQPGKPSTRIEVVLNGTGK